MKYAIIDIGSNSIKMLRFSRREDLLEPEYQVEIPQLVKGQKRGILSLESVERSLQTLDRFINSCEEEEIFIYATQSLRGAKNPEVFLQKVEEMGYPVDILSEEQEAKLAFLAASFTLKPPLSVLDIGGASTELAWGRDQMETYKSFPIGSLVLHENRDFPLPFIEANDSPLVGIGGTVTSICSMVYSMALFNRQRIDGTYLSYEKIEDLYRIVSQQSVEERKMWIGLDPKRRPIIDSGIKILLHVIKSLGVKGIHVSGYTGMDGYALYKGLI